MDAFDLLISDHNRVRGLFHQVDEAKDVGDLTVMATVAEGLEEHHEVKVLMAEATMATDDLRATVSPT